MRKQRISLRWGLLTAILLCWIAAVLIVITTAGILIDYNFDRSLEQRMHSDSEGILKQLQLRISDSMESSKEISYDGVVRSAYRRYQTDGDGISLYRTVTEYLSGGFSRDARVKAVFMSFWEPEITSRIYVINEKASSYRILQQFLTQVRPEVMSLMADADTGIRFLVRDGELYLCRNLLDSGFRPYATVTMLCDTAVLLQALQPLTSLGNTMLCIDGQQLLLDSEEHLSDWPPQRKLPENANTYSTDIDGHTFSFSVSRTDFHIWTDLPGLRTAAAAGSLAVLPILGVMIWLFYRTVSIPIDQLVAGAMQIRAGKRGFQITAVPNNREFAVLFDTFNAMSADLKEQFERSLLEQQAAQQAQIRALQSQINPHFLNNTLEVINWEARLAGNDNVSEMIDALATMLDAALDRDGTGTVPLRQELEYVRAYLRIIHRRLGDRFQYDLEAAEDLQELRVPRLVLQPVVENAVEHDITPRKGGRLTVRVSRRAQSLLLEVLHQGSLSEEDREQIRALLQGGGRSGHVGLRNVAARLRLLYGDRSSILVEEFTPGMVRACIELPLNLPI